VALRGDPPQGAEEFEPAPNGLAHGRDLVALIRAEESLDGQRVGVAVAGYPETHPEAPDPQTDAEHLKAKVAAGGDVIITQLFFDNRDFFAFRDRVRALGIGVPVVPGLMPAQSTRQLEHITAMCGARIPEELRGRLLEADDDSQAMAEIGAQYCLEQARGLLDNDVPGIHFYVLNRTLQMAFIVKGLGL
jgi:methylenetetrahydrofolate reductase (NADPH)